MSPETLYLAILVGAAVLFMTEWLPMEVTSLLIIVSLALSGILTPKEALSGFSNMATLTVGAMFVLSAGLMRTGALENLTIYLAEFSKGSPRRLLILLGLTVPVASAFINNTPVVAMMVPVIISLSLRFDMSPSKLLIPVSYFAILGGTLTLIGTSTNILVNELKVEAGLPPFGLFDFAPLGAIFIVVGGALIILLSGRLLPEKTGLGGSDGLAQRVYVARFLVPDASSLVGRKASESFDHVQSPPEAHVRLSGIRRIVPETILPAPADLRLLSHSRADGSLPSHLADDEQVHAQDRLLIAGQADAIVRFQTQHGLSPGFGVNGRIADAGPPAGDRLVMQAVVLSDSTLIGRSLTFLDSMAANGVRMLGFMPPSVDAMQASPERVIQSGDALLLEGPLEGLNALQDRYRVTLIRERARVAAQFRKNSTAIVIMTTAVLAAAFSGLPIVLVALAGALAMILTRCLTLQDAFNSLNGRTLMLLAGTIPLGLGMQAAGIIDPVVDVLLQGPLLANPMLTVAALYLAASVLTQLVSNAAVAVLFVPIALGLAQTTGMGPQPLLMAIAFGASASFMSPTGYQTNAIVMEPGGYSYADYLRLGVPLQIVMWLVASVCIPLLYG